MRGVGPNVNTVSMTVFEQNVHDADKPTTSAFITHTPYTNNRCMVSQSYYNGRFGTMLGQQTEGFTQFNGCTFNTAYSSISNQDAKISFVSEYNVAPEVVEMTRTGLANAWIKFGVAPKGAKEGWISSGGQYVQLVQLVDKVSYATPSGAMELASVWVALLASLAIFMM